MKNFIKIDYSDSFSLVISISDISHVYFDSIDGLYHIVLKTCDHEGSYDYVLPSDFSIDEFYLDVEDRFHL